MSNRYKIPQMQIHWRHLLSYPCSDIVRNQLHEIIASLPSNAPPVVQVSEKSYAVFGLPTASNPLGFFHVKIETKCKSGFSCTGKDCRSYAAKAKGCAVGNWSLRPQTISSPNISSPSLVDSSPNATHYKCQFNKCICGKDS